MSSVAAVVCGSVSPPMTSKLAKESMAVRAAASAGCRDCGNEASVLAPPRHFGGRAETHEGDEAPIVIGKDDRRFLTPEEQRHFRSVGKIVCAHSSIGDGQVIFATAWLPLDRRLFATNVHAFINENYRQAYVPERDCAFRLYDGNGVTVFESRIKPATSYGSYSKHLTGATSVVQEDDSDDWAVGELATPAPDDILPMSIATGSTEWLSQSREVSLVGFHTGEGIVSRRQYISEDCRAEYVGVTALDPNGVAFRHTCDTDSGASGSPVVFRKRDGSFLVIGVHFGGPETGDPERDYNRAFALMDGFAQLSMQESRGSLLPEISCS